VREKESERERERVKQQVKMRVAEVQLTETALFTKEIDTICHREKRRHTQTQRECCTPHTKVKHSLIDQNPIYAALPQPQLWDEGER